MTKSGESLIRHPHSDPADTFRDGDSSTPAGLSSGRGPLTISHNRVTEQPIPHLVPHLYLATMTTAKAALDAIDASKPNLPGTYRHNLLFFCQGHHLATHGMPMFTDPMRATSAGVTVELGEQAGSALGKRAHGMVGRVMQRYGGMYPVDLRCLVTVSTACQRASNSSDTRIEPAWLTDWFSRPDELSHEGRIAVADIAAILGAART